MNRKKDPRTQFIIVRVTPSEKNRLVEDAMEDNTKLSEYIRAKLGLQKENI